VISSSFCFDLLALSSLVGHLDVDLCDLGQRHRHRQLDDSNAAAAIVLDERFPGGRRVLKRHRSIAVIIDGQPDLEFALVDLVISSASSPLAAEMVVVYTKIHGSIPKNT
jgi:hypothetical protein